MNEAIAHETANAAGRRLMNDLINALIAERFLDLEERPAVPVASIHGHEALYPGQRPDALAYVGDVLLLVRSSIRQGFEWEPGTPVYARETNGETGSCAAGSADGAAGEADHSAAAAAALMQPEAIAAHAQPEAAAAHVQPEAAAAPGTTTPARIGAASAQTSVALSRWREIRSATELARAALGGEAYPGAAEFVRGLEAASWQLGLSLDRSATGLGHAPRSPGEWFVRAERIASLRDRPYHPTAKAKLGFTPDDYERYMAEFGRPTVLRWVAIASGSVVRGSPEDGRSALDALSVRDRTAVKRELERRGLPTDRYTPIPVHPWQLENKILPEFARELNAGTIVLLETRAGDYLATSSVRSLVSAHDPAISLKLPVSVPSLGAARYLPVVKLLNGLSGERIFRQALSRDEKLAGRVFLCEEGLWWGYMPRGMGLFDEHPRHLAAQLRLYPRELLEGEYKVVPMAALGVVREEDHLLSELLGRRATPEEAFRFYEATAELFCDVALRLFKIGIVPELHGQNVCLVLKGNEPAALLFRDHDSVRLHPPYLDRHGIGDPGYRIRPGYSNSLYNETPEKLMFYIQTLGTQVNLASIMEALAVSYGLTEERLWEATEASLRAALARIELPADDKARLGRLLFESETWPVKLIVRPLLETEGVPGAMPSGKGEGPNPFRRWPRPNR